MLKDALIYVDFGFRVLVLIACLTFGMIFLFAGARAALASSLRPVSVISDNVLRVGDIFEGLSEEKANTVLGPAPQPGKEMILNATTLIRIASALDLSWRPETTADQIVIRREATIIGQDIVKSLISEKLFEAGLSDRYRLNMPAGIGDIVLPADMPAQAEVIKFDFNPEKDTFETVIAAPSASNPLREISVNGTIERLVDIPVLKNGLKNGDIIGETDIDYIQVLQKDVQRDYVIDSAKMLGMTPRRMVAAGKPVRDLELENPQIIARGAAITLIYKDGPLTLSARGKSMQNGARGDVIRVVNMASNRSLEGLVTAENEVIVSP
ncbi:MAG: flagellar basal body P-ring formation protein FlgA [Micavibrio aeruginosavorus]|uniref:Flagellar basal body P-ring formation protein FlgA n=1 Tax=Micavibrio aeruginosavorus TaxID=349221 RepID=A0A7T5R1L7_9BACT|nr:MAG: flagellar basal body P-ring formation protein FlgA [Micavibrio aeruginosavorus]